MNYITICNACSQRLSKLCIDASTMYLCVLQKDQNEEYSRLESICLDTVNTAPNDVQQDLIRSCFLLAVSSFDSTLRSISYIGGALAYAGIVKRSYLPKKLKSKYYTSKKYTCAELHSSMGKTLDRTTFLRPDSINMVGRFIGMSEVNMWTKISQKTNISSDEIKKHLSLIADRRNLIIHYNDILLGQKLPITDRNSFINSLKFLHELKIAFINLLLSEISA